MGILIPPIHAAFAVSSLYSRFPEWMSLSIVISEQVRILAIVEAPCHFVKIGGEMFRRNPMPRSHNPALQERERRFNRVGMNVAIYVDLYLVQYRLVLAGNYEIRDQGVTASSKMH